MARYINVRCNGSIDLDNCKETDNVYFDDQASHSHRYKDVGTNAFMKGYN